MFFKLADPLLSAGSTTEPSERQISHNGPVDPGTTAIRAGRVTGLLSS